MAGLEKLKKSELINKIYEMEKNRDSKETSSRKLKVVEDEAKLHKHKKSSHPDEVMNSVKQTKGKVIGSFTEIETQLIEKNREFVSLIEAISIARDKLREIHGFTSMLEDYDGAKELFLNATAEINKKIALAIETSDAECESLADETRTLRASELKKRRDEQDEYDYNLKLQRKRELNKWQDDQAKTKKEFQAGIDEREAELDERENKLVQACSEIEDMKKRIDGIPAEIERAKATAVNAAVASERVKTDAARKDYEYETDLRCEKANSHAASMAERVKDLTEDLTSAKKEINEYRNRMTSLADNVVKGVSNQKFNVNVADSSARK